MIHMRGSGSGGSFQSGSFSADSLAVAEKTGITAKEVFTKYVFPMTLLVLSIACFFSGLGMFGLGARSILILSSVNLGLDVMQFLTRRLFAAKNEEQEAVDLEEFSPLTSDSLCSSNSAGSIDSDQDKITVNSKLTKREIFVNYVMPIAIVSLGILSLIISMGILPAGSQLIFGLSATAIALDTLCFFALYKLGMKLYDMHSELDRETYAGISFDPSIGFSA